MPRVPILQSDVGTKTGSIYSGQVAPALTGTSGGVAVGSDVLLQSGPGRLVGVLTHTTYLSLSGVAINFYDAAAPVSGGPVAASGHRPVGVVPGAYGVSGQVAGPIFQPFNIPFLNGLCVNSRSGQVGFTASWVPEPNQ